LSRPYNCINDLPAFEIVGKKICPSDSAIEIKSICDHVLSKKGGEGVLREISIKFNSIF
jgi:3-deoxy-D-manno-octulosonate 8-phosphate phosphatase KdsC-like HAD superfamily phosphatase